MAIRWRLGQQQQGDETTGEETRRIAMRPVEDPDGCFAYEYTDIPPGITLREWQHSHTPPVRRLVRLHHRARLWIRQRI